MSTDVNPLQYWTPGPAVPPAVRLTHPRGRSEDRVDWLTMLVVTGIAAAMAFCIVISMAWVLGH